MTPTIDIDFETFSKVSIKDVGMDNYANHPSTYVICMAYRIEGETLTRLWTPGKAHKIPKNYILRAHNVAFELAIIKSLGQSIGLNKPKGVICTAAKAAVMGYPRSLEGASKAMGLPLIKDTEGKGVMLQVTKPRNPSKTNPRLTWFFDKEKMKRTYRYCIQDVDVECLIDEGLPNLSDKEAQIFALDAEINERGLYVDVELADAAVGKAEAHIELLNTELSLLTKGEATDLRKIAKLKAWMASQGSVFPSLAKDVMETVLSDKSLRPDIRRALEIRKEGSMTSIAKYKKILAWVGKGRRIRNLLMYHGASTGRWTGKGPQLHNLPRGIEIDKDEAIDLIKNTGIQSMQLRYEKEGVMNVLSSCIRECLMAEPGKTLIAGDFAGIEVRVLAWMAGEESLLKLIEDGGDPYVDMASAIYLVEAHAVTKKERAIGKMAVLGLGYQMGHNTFMVQCAKNGIVIDEEFAKRVVKTYRSKYKKIKAFWKECEMAMVDCNLFNEDIHMSTCEVQFLKNGDMTEVYLPSGRNLNFIDCKVSQGRFGPKVNHMLVNSMTRQWNRRDTYGGLLTENIVQAVARDILTDAMLRVDQYFDIVHHVHDEIVVEEPVWDNIGSDPATHFKELMTEVPAWAEGLPIDVDIWSQERYKK